MERIDTAAILFEAQSKCCSK